MDETKIRICEQCIHEIEPELPRVLNRATFTDGEGLWTVERYFHPGCVLPFVAAHAAQFIS